LRTVSSLCIILITFFVLLGSAQNSLASVSVSVQSPGNGASVTSPVTFKASASSPNGISGWVIYVDNQNKYQVDNYSGSLTAGVSLGGGSHSVYIRAWDNTGAYGTSPAFTINVGGTSSSGALPTPPSTAKVFSNLDQSTSSWSSCSDCAGGSYTSNYWKAFWQTSPSMDGASLQFFNGGGPWADVLWIKKLGNQNWASNFLWDFYVYFDSTTAANLWSAEYDLWQSIGGYEYMIGTQCVFGTGEWDTWDQQAGHWVKTSIPCPRFSPGTWHHIQWYMQRISGNRYKYVTLVVDGKAYSVNQTYYANYSGWDDDFGVQWQLDLNGNGTDAHEWIDKVKVSIW
jgi:Bacterial Ig domain